MYQRSALLNVQFQIGSIEVDGVDQVSVRSLENDSATALAGTRVDGSLDVGSVLRDPTEQLSQPAGQHLSGRGHRRSEVPTSVLPSPMAPYFVTSQVASPISTVT